MKKNKILNIFKLIILGLPNSPFILILFIYMMYNIFKNTNVIDIHMEEGFKMTDEIKNHIDKIYPKTMSNSIALIFWLYIIFKHLN